MPARSATLFGCTRSTVGVVPATSLIRGGAYDRNRARRSECPPTVSPETAKTVPRATNAAAVTKRLESKRDDGNRHDRAD